MPVERGGEGGGGDFCGGADGAALAPEAGQGLDKFEVGGEDAGDERPGGLAIALELGGGAVAAAHGEEVIEIAERGGEEGAGDARGGEVLDDEAEAVAFDVERL